MNQVYIYILLFAVFVLALFILQIKLKIYFKELKAKKRLKRGIDKENEAAKFLRKNGYKIISHHKKHYYTVKANSQTYKITLETDYEAVKNGKHYIIEVKSGQSAIKITNSSTRRQILEYYSFISADGVILLDMESKTLYEIEFPKQKAKLKINKFYFFGFYVLSAILLLIIFAFVKDFF